MNLSSSILTEMPPPLPDPISPIEDGPSQPTTAEWGLVKGLRVGTASKPFFRTAVHEIGHAMGFFHNTVDNGFMNTTDVDEAHAEVALKVLATPETLLTLAIGGDHLADGIDAVRTALNNAVLAPHFAFIEAKRLAERFGKRKADLKAAANLIDDACVMSQAEVRKAARFAGHEKADAAARTSIAKTLKKRMKKLDVSEETRSLVESL